MLHRGEAAVNKSCEYDIRQLLIEDNLKQTSKNDRRTFDLSHISKINVANNPLLRGLPKDFTLACFKGQHTQFIIGHECFIACLTILSKKRFLFDIYKTQLT